MNMLVTLEIGYRNARIENIRWKNSGRGITQGSGTLGDLCAIDYTGPFVGLKMTVSFRII
jgi:hypothetical protein